MLENKPDPLGEEPLFYTKTGTPVFKRDKYDGVVPPLSIQNREGDLTAPPRPNIGLFNTDRLGYRGNAPIPHDQIEDTRRRRR